MKVTKNSKARIIIALWLMCCVASAALPFEGWYLGFLLGPNHISSLKYNFTNPLTHTYTHNKLFYDNSLIYGGQLGFRYDKIRAEVELGYSRNTYKKIKMGGAIISNENNSSGLNIQGNTNFFSTMVNAYYEFYEDEVEVRFVPYVGLGGGYTYVKNSLNLIFMQKSIYGRNVNASAVMGQVIAGTSYFIDDTHSFSVDYRYLTTPKHQSLQSTVVSQSINLIGNISFY